MSNIKHALVRLYILNLKKMLKRKNRIKFSCTLNPALSFFVNWMFLRTYSILFGTQDISPMQISSP